MQLQSSICTSAAATQDFSQIAAANAPSHPPKKKVLNSDALAAEEAKMLGTSTKRERRPRVRQS
jgi:hypothetical protein